MNWKFLILICLILFFVSIVGVSAADDVNQTIDDDTLSVSIDNELSAKDSGTFTELQEKINNAQAGSTITLNNDYLRDDSSDPNRIIIDKALTINGNGHKIDVDGSYYGQSRIFYITSSNVVLNDIDFLNAYVLGHYSNPGSSNGGAIYSEKNLILNNCNFINCYIQDGFGAAVYSSADVTINRCTFTKNSGYAFSGYSASSVISAKNVFANACSFHDNKYTTAISSDNDLIVENSIFRNNTGGALGAGGKVNVKKSNFINDVYSSGSGGAILTAGDVKVEDCNFTGNYGYCGGAISLGGNAEIYNCNFINNSATESGGAVYLGEKSEVSLVNSNFTKNSAIMGGAIYINGKNHVLHSLNFIENSAFYGGALSYGECIGTVVNNCNFIKNSADDGGGAIDCVYAFNYIENCYFADNYCRSGEMIGFGKSLGLIFEEGNLVSKISNIKIKQNLSNLYAEGISLKDNILTVHGYYNHDFLSGDITVSIAGKTFKKSLDSKGLASFDLNGLSGGIHDATISCVGGIGGSTSEYTIPIPIESSTKLHVPDVTKNYGGSERLEVTLTEGGSPVANANVNININGVDYSRTTDSKGKASMAINLPVGTYDVIVTYKDISTSAKVTVNPLNTKTTLTYTKNSHNSVTLTATISPATAGGKVTFIVDGKEYSAAVSDAKATYTLNNLVVGSYEAKATYSGDVNHKSSSSASVKFTVEDVKIDVSAPDLTKYYNGPERFVVTVKEDYKAVVGKDVTITLNGMSYTRTTDSNGQASMAINLNSGVYTVLSEFEGIKVHSKVTVKATISGKDITKIYKNDTQYFATFVDTSGKLLKNTDVRFNINGVFYTRTTNENGHAKLNINLNPGEYVITAINPVSTEMSANVVKVLPNIVENHDLTKYYKNESKYTFRLLDDYGKPVGAGVSAIININGVLYTRLSNATGYVNMNINLEPGTYIATVIYKDLMLSNTVKVLPILEAKDLNMKYRDGSKFEAKLLDGRGRPFANQTITFNINGVFYERTTDASGIARLNINLMAGQYIITSMYENGAVIANKITISS